MERESTNDEAALRMLEAARKAAERRGLRGPDADDVAGETALAFVRRSEIPHNPGGFGTTVGTRRAIDEYRRRDRHAIPTDPTVMPTEVTELTVEEEVTVNMLVDVLTEYARDCLSDRQLDAYNYLIESGGSVRDAVKLAAAFTGVTENAMRTHLERALVKLRSAIPDWNGSKQ